MITHSVNTVPVNNPSATQARNERAWQVAKEFEAMFTSMMFKAMRGTVGEGELIKRSMGEEIFTEMLDDEYAKMCSETGQLGLATLIYKEMQRREGGGENIEIPSSVGGGNVPLWALERQARASKSSRAYSAADSAALVSRVQENWGKLISDASQKYGVDEHLITAVIARESAGNPRAVSHKGAKGLMQLMDGTAREMGVQYSFSPAENINGGVKYLRLMLDTFGGDERKALAAYNAGPGAVRRHNGIPPFKETQEYVVAVGQLRSRSARTAELVSVEPSEQNNNVTK